ncbi:MAG TPA: M23 family metallopeptidase [Candidatus Polarisedimenticolia bacterium]|nr:M23 family metallopeptidase [Candidatus Polarisedimenticolia bacterium]
MHPSPWILCALLVALPSAPDPRSESRYRPPLDGEASPVSSFGEYRPDHLHPGIDLSTGGRTGLPVHAIADGDIFRLKVEWRGYGRAVYVRHADGRISVFAHLESFEEKTLKLESRVAAARQQTRSRYPGDIYIDPPLRVRRGQVIALTGESGAGLPHLHFELRRDDAHPADPSPAVGTIREQPAIRFEALILLAAEPSALVQGERSAEIRLFRDAAGYYMPASPPVVTGSFLPEARLVSEDREGHRFGIRQLTVILDGTAVYRFRMEEFSFDAYPQIGLLMDHARSRLSPAASTYRLQRVAGNELGRVHEASESPWPALSPGNHLLEVEAAGAFGGSARARVPFRIVRPPELGWKQEAAPRDGTVRMSLTGWEPEGATGGKSPITYAFLGQEGAAPCRERTSEPQGEACTFEIASGSQGIVASLDEAGVVVKRLLQPLAAGGSASVTLLPRPRPGFLDLELASLSGPPPIRARLLGEGGKEVGTLEVQAIGENRLAIPLSFDLLRLMRKVVLEWPDGLAIPSFEVVPEAVYASPESDLRFARCGVELQIPKGALYGPAALACESVRQPAAKEGAGALPRGPAVRLLPEGLPLSHKAPLRFPIPADVSTPNRLGIYRLDSASATWVYQGGERQGDAFVFNAGRFDTYALMEDVTPPTVLGIEPAPQGRPRSPFSLLKVRVQDDASGLGYDGVHLTVDGAELLMEYDPDRGWATGRTDRPLSRGTHALECWAEDRAGNRAPTKSFQVEIR